MAEHALHIRVKCDHPGAGPTSHRCPECRGTLRRCCDSVIGTAHIDRCHESRPGGYEAALEVQANGG